MKQLVIRIVQTFFSIFFHHKAPAEAPEVALQKSYLGSEVASKKRSSKQKHQKRAKVDGSFLVNLQQKHQKAGVFMYLWWKRKFYHFEVFLYFFFRKGIWTFGPTKPSTFLQWVCRTLVRYGPQSKRPGTHRAMLEQSTPRWHQRSPRWRRLDASIQSLGRQRACEGGPVWVDG